MIPPARLHFFPIVAAIALSHSSLAVEVAALMPRHGTVSTAPAGKWEDGLAAGNGIHGAMLYGDPAKDTLLVNHCKLWLPAGSREVVPEVGSYLAEMRRIIGEKGYDEGQKFFFAKARESGWGGKLVWTDAFHPGFFLKLDQPATGEVTDYARVENFATGEVWTQWKTDAGEFSRRLFISRTDNTIVCTTTGPKGKVSLSAAMDPLRNSLIESQIQSQENWITCHNTYVNGKGGYDGAVRVTHVGGTLASSPQSVSVKDADSVTLLIRILPWRTPLPGSQAWSNDAANPDFLTPQPLKRGTVQIPGKAYSPQWMNTLKSDLGSMSANYADLFAPHTKAWGALFNRVTIDLNGSPEERAMSSEEILAKAKQERRLSPALLERMYDAGRYVFMCAAGPETPPNLFGIWTGTWSPKWSGDYTTDTNLQLDTELAYAGNLAELMSGYYFLWDQFLPDMRRNAKALYGCRGSLIGSRASNNALALHWDEKWPGNLWTPGTAWMAHWYYDHYLYTGDRDFLQKTAIPWMKDAALFYEDFLKGTEDASGKFTFRPSYSAENGWGDNTAQDIQIVTELLTNLIAGCETLAIEKEGIVRWKAMLAKMPPLLINEKGALKEWANPKQGERDNHRHLMHLYGAFESRQFTEESDPKLFEAAKVALINRCSASKEDSTHGFMHTGLAAAGLGMGDLAYSRIEHLVYGPSIYPNMVNAHNGGPRILCDDGNGATPEIVHRMFIQSEPGKLYLLPAVPKSLPIGSLNGTRARGAISVVRLAWNMGRGTCETTLSSDTAQTIDLVLPRDMKVSSIQINGKAGKVIPQGVNKLGCKLELPKDQEINISISFSAMPMK